LSATFLDQVQVISSPLLEVIDLQTQMDLHAAEGVIFSSSNAVACSEKGRGRSAYCIGTATTLSAQSAGWRAQMAGENADALVANLTNQKPKTPLIHLAGQHQRGDIALRLTKAGLKTEILIVYNQLLKPVTAQVKAALRGEVPVFVPLFSPRTSQQFASELSALPNYAKNQMVVVALSEAVAAPLDNLGINEVIVTSRPTAQDMREALEMRLATISLP
jgi:uroporphyrinogen-III synthase